MKTLLLAGFAFMVAGLYFYNFNDYMAQNQSTWGAFGDYIGGILNPVIAFFVFYYVVKNYESQKEYFKKQEFENHFFKLYDEFKLEQENIHQSKIFEQYNNQVHDDNITNLNVYKEWVFSRIDYPKSYFNLLEFLLAYIHKNQQIGQYNFFIKNKLSNLDLAYIALNDMCVKKNNLPMQLDIYEHFDKEDDDIIDLIFILKDYPPLKKQIESVINEPNNKKDFHEN